MDEHLIEMRKRNMKYLEEFQRLMMHEPKRTGKPENWLPSRMKGIWK